ncbi:putative aspartic peptidase domain-containing protein [Lupinus albus]|uniref:Putative aspartic peptidase domain-containing protein n=1 Tax=Lupinus albus TaxID=3870 RepID=A0A6A4NJW2_LUPAL|nr:putative aspartic peptidase domain-containing protein [Lupinus albus]
MGRCCRLIQKVFKTPSNKGVTIDSGTTMAYFTEGAYNPIVDAITGTIPQYVGTIDDNGFRCYLITTRLG